MTVFLGSAISGALLVALSFVSLAGAQEILPASAIDVLDVSPDVPSRVGGPVIRFVVQSD